MSNWALVREIKNVLGYNTFWYVNVKCHILLNFIIFLYAHTCKRPVWTCRLHTGMLDFLLEILKMLFFWPNLLPHLPHWSLCHHTIFTYIFLFSDIVERSSIPFLISFFQNNLISPGAALTGNCFFLIILCSYLFSGDSLIFKLLNISGKLLETILHVRELHFGNSYAVFFFVGGRTNSSWRHFCHHKYYCGDKQ